MAFVRRLFAGASLVGFLLLFPGFALYHYAIAAGLAPAFAGGLFGAAAAATAALGATSLYLRLRSGESPLLEQGFIALCVYLLAWTAGFALVSARRGHTRDAILEAVSTVAIWIAAYFVGARLRPFDRPASTWLASSAALVGLTFLHATAGHGSFLGPFLTFRGDAAGVETVTTYQGVGRSILVLAILVGAGRRHLWTRLGVLCVAALGLLALGSRAHLFAIGLLVGLQVILLALRGRSLSVRIAVVALVVFAGWASSELFLETRAAEILDLAQSTSWQARAAATDEALSIIANHPFFGRFGYHLGESAGYAHNVLSAWANFGLVAFLGYMGLLAWGLAIAGRRVLLTPEPARIWMVAFELNLAALFLGLTSEPIFASVLPALGWGFTVNALETGDVRD